MKNLIMAVLILIPSLSFAVGSPDFLPDGAHPRIWLDNAELSRLNAKQAGADANWTALESWCDTHISDTGFNEGRANWPEASDDLGYYGYEMSGYAVTVMNYALAYQVLKDDNPAKAATYATRVRNILVDGVATSFKSGENAYGLKAIRLHPVPNDRTINAGEAAALGLTVVSYKQGYSSRSLAAIPIAFDWIYESGALSAGDKTLLTNMMLRWFDWCRGVHGTYNDGVLISGVRYHEDQNGDCTGINNCTTVTGASAQALNYGKVGYNYGGGHLYLMSLIPVATYGENTDIPTYLSDIKTHINNTWITNLESDTSQSGGDAPEGWNYGGGYQYVLQGLYGYYTGTGDTAISSMAWPASLVEAMLHRTMADYLKIPIYGYWTGPPYGENRIGFTSQFVGIEQRLHPSSDESGLGQYLLDNVAYNGVLNEWEAVLWPRSDIPEINPSTQPLTYRATGNGLFTSRSAWGDANAVHLTARLEGKNYTDHESYDDGTILLARGTDRLLAYQNTEAAPSVTSNSIVFKNASHHTFNPSLSTPVIDKVAEETGYSYVSGELSNAWKRIYQVDRCKLFRRSILHILPGYVVVSDHTQANTAYDSVGRKDWYTQYLANPDITGNTISATVGSSKIYTQTIYPTGGAYTETNPATGYYRVAYRVDGEFTQFLHVIEATASASARTATTAISGTGGRGVLISDATENKVVMVSDSASAANITSLSYSVDTSAASRHYITDLQPSTLYYVVIDEGDPVEYTSSSAGIIEFANPSFSPHTYNIGLQSDLVAPNPAASKESGAFQGPQLVTLSSDEVSVTFYYTLDGTTPTEASTVYSSAIPVLQNEATTVLKYFAKDAAGNSSAVQTQTYRCQRCR